MIGSRPRALVAVLAVVLPVAACGPFASDPQPSGTPASSSSSSPAAPDPALARYYSQALDWTSCASGYQCATLTVPVDYARPEAGDTSIAVTRRRSKGATSSLVVNPGGPGGSGVEYAQVAQFVIGPSVRKAYDIVGFDPRGVAGSDPVHCLSDAELDELFAADGTPDDPAEVAEVARVSGEVGPGCAAGSARLAGHVDTVSAARDMDILRAALGDEQLTYLGKSYGTLLGAQYADLFPSRVGRMVLDGALPGNLDGDQITHDQAVAFDVALQRFVADCVTQDDCPLPSEADAAMARVRQFIDDLDAHPLPGIGDRTLNQALGMYAILTALYDWQFGWPQLRYGLEAAFEGDGSVLLDMVNDAVKREANGTYEDNGNEAFFAVSCLDRPSSGGVDHVEELARQWAQDAPVFGEYLAWGTLPCDGWPLTPEAPAGQPRVLRAEGSAPILVVSTRYDPATPYQWGVTVADQLANAGLLTFEGDGHTGYMAGSTCVDRAVDAYYLSGTMPAEGATCQPDPVSDGGF